MGIRERLVGFWKREEKDPFKNVQVPEEWIIDGESCDLPLLHVPHDSFHTIQDQVEQGELKIEAILVDHENPSKESWVVRRVPKKVVIGAEIGAGVITGYGVYRLLRHFLSGKKG